MNRAAAATARFPQLFISSESQQRQKSRPANSSRHACIRKQFQIIVVRVIHDQRVVIRFISWIRFLQRAEAGAGQFIFLNDAQSSPVHHQAPVTRKMPWRELRESFECGSDSEPRSETSCENDK